MQTPRIIFLIGPPGVGKNAVGELLAQTTGRAFYDTDQEVSAQAGRSIAQIFAEDGEQAFRSLESEVLEKLVDKLAEKADAKGAVGAVVATGGGIVLDPRNAALMREHGRTVWLQASGDTLEQRLEHSSRRGERPLLQDESWRRKLRQLLRQREPLYRQAADQIVQRDGLNREQTAEQIISRLQD